MRRFLLVVLGLGALGMALWAWSAPQQELPAKPPQAPAERLAQHDPIGSEVPAAESRDEQPAPQRQPVGEARGSRGPDDLVVLVRDTASRPLANLPVTVSTTPRLRDLDDGDYEVRRTDRQGRVVFPAKRAEVRASGRSFYVVHDVLFDQLPHTVLDASALAGDVVVSVQPPFATLVVLAVEADGRPASQVDRAALGLVDPKEAGDPTLAWQRKTWPGQLVDGRARFDWVELGRSWAGSIYRVGADTASTTLGEGPTVPGEMATLAVTLDLDHPVGVFRAVNAQGMPLAKAQLEVALERNFGGKTDLAVETDAAGHFAVDTTGMNWLGEHIRVRFDRPGQETLTGAAHLLDSMQAGRNDCGDVILRERTPLVSGRLTDARGLNLAGVTVRAGPEVRDRPPWIISHRGTVAGKTDDQGRFTVFGDIPLEPFRVWAEHGNLRSSGAMAHRGDRNVHLVAYQVYTPSVDVLLPEGGAWDGVTITMTPSGAAEPRIGTTHAFQEGNTVQVTMREVREGLYDLTWSFGNTPLGQLTDLQVHSNDTIARIDLRGALFAHAIELIPPASTAANDLEGAVLWRLAGSAAPWNTQSILESTVRLNVPASAVDVRVLARGCREVALFGVRGVARAELRAGYLVRFVLETDGEIPTHPYLFDPAPMRHRTHVGEPVGSPYFTATKREAVFRVPAGRIEVAWHLERRIDNAAIGGNVMGNRNLMIDVAESAAEQVFVLELDGEALTRLPDSVGW